MGKPKSPKLPPANIAPTLMDAKPAEEDVLRRSQRRSGYQNTILTGALTPSKKSTVLG